MLTLFKVCPSFQELADQATIVGGLSKRGVNTSCDRFTFYLGIPIMFGASGLKTEYQG